MKPYKPVVRSALTAIAAWDIAEYRQPGSNGLTFDAVGRPRDPISLTRGWSCTLRGSFRWIIG
ncbi:MAG: hypothetical protein ACREX9_23125 [Gammaproteobacteria bacterium]